MDIQKHVEGHAVKIFNKNNRVLKESKTVNFTASIDVAQFIIQGYETQKKIDSVMIAMFENITSKAHTFNFKNGIRKKKDGTIIQKYRKNVIDLANTVSAYHNLGVNNFTSVEPHIHILFEKNELYFNILQNILQIEASRHNLVFNFAEETRINHHFTDHQQLQVKRFSWACQINSDNDFIKLIKSNTFDDMLLFFIEYTKTRDLIAMRIKTMEYIKKRLNHLCIDKNVILDHKSYNLRNSYPLHIRQSDYILLQKLQNEDYPEVFFRKSLLSREYLKHCYGFRSELMIVLDYINYQLPILAPDKVKKSFQKDIILKTKYDENVHGTVSSLQSPSYELNSIERKTEKIDLEEYHRLDIEVDMDIKAIFQSQEEEVEGDIKFLL